MGIFDIFKGSDLNFKGVNVKEVKIIATEIDDPEADVEVYADSDTDHRYITVNILDKVLH